VFCAPVAQVKKACADGARGFLASYEAEHRQLLLLIPVMLRESTDFFPGGATGFVAYLGKWRKKI
jgi:hypothetical protein